MADPSSESFADFVESLRYPTGAARGSEWQTPETVRLPGGVGRRLEAFARSYDRRERRVLGFAVGPRVKAPALLLTDVTRAQELFVLEWLVRRLSLRRYSFDPRDFRTKTPDEISEVIAPLYDTHAAIVHVNGVDGVAWAWTQRALESRSPDVCVIATATSGAAVDPAMIAAFGAHIAWVEDDGSARAGLGALAPHP
ncbi:MAG: hypothetical protein NVS1B2_25040 [Vulcanimicrobiaceae bacterium]